MSQETSELLQSMPLSDALKQYSRKTHDSVDNLVMSMQPFASVENYAKFLQAQHEFHETVRPLYADAELNEKIAGLQDLTRAERVLSDMNDLNVTPANIELARPTPEGLKRIGWLYCVEGSNVGAAILYKEAGKIALTDEHGASHLAPHPDGRMPHWRNFKALLDNLDLTIEQKQQVLLGSDEAFAYFKQLISVMYYDVPF